MLVQILKTYPDQVRLIYRHYPLVSIHDKAALAAQAAEAAGNQGNFWEFHDRLFKNWDTWNQMSTDDFEQWLVAQAGELQIDEDQFTSDMSSPEIVAIAQQAWERNSSVGLPGTPFLLVNGQIWPNNLPLTYGNIVSMIDLNLLEKRQFTTCPPMTIDSEKRYTATLHTEKGDIVIELFAKEAPLAVNNFIFLARNGWYDSVTFHRVIAGFVAQAGDPSGTGFGSPGYAFSNEISPNLKFDNAGLVGMANAGPNTNGSQFFITFVPTPNLDGQFTIFGQVISGMDVANSLAPRDPSQFLDLPPGDKILSITIQEQ